MTNIISDLDEPENAAPWKAPGAARLRPSTVSRLLNSARLIRRDLTGDLSKRFVLDAGIAFREDGREQVNIA